MFLVNWISPGFPLTRPPLWNCDALHIGQGFKKSIPITVAAGAIWVLVALGGDDVKLDSILKAPPGFKL